MPLSPTQESNFNQTGRVTNAFVYLHTPTLIFEAPLVGGVQRAKAFVAITVGTPTVGTWASIKPEMLLQIDIAGVGDGGRQRVRGIDQPNSRVLIGRAGTGRSDGRVTVDLGGTVRIYEDYRPFIKAPYISLTTIDQYKDETLYTDANTAQPPVACAGTDRLVLTTAATASVVLDGLGAVPSFAVRNGATLASYQWDIKDGTATVGSMTTSAVTVTFPRGTRHISLTVTDSNGKTHTTYRLIAVLAPSECIPATLDTMTVTPEGNSLSLRVKTNRIPAGLPTGAKALVAVQENYGDTIIGYAERFSGWVGEESSALLNARYQIAEVDMTLYDIGKFLQNNYLFPQSLNIAEDTGGWYRMVKANIDRLMHYALHWHTNVLSLASVKLSGVGTTYPFQQWTTGGAAVWADLSSLAAAFAHELTVDMRNTLRVVRDPHVQASAAQATAESLPTQRPTGIVTTLTLSRYGKYKLSARQQPTAYWLNASALIAAESINAVVSCIAPSNAPSFGTSAPNENSLLVTTQAELNVWAANMYASRHSPTISGLEFDTINPSAVIEPALREFVHAEPG